MAGCRICVISSNRWHGKSGNWDYIVSPPLDSIHPRTWFSTSPLHSCTPIRKYPCHAAGLTISFRASLTDLEPCIPLDDIEVDVDSTDVFTLSCLARASQHAGQFVRDYHNPRFDVTSDEYVRGKQEEWSAVLAFLRNQKTSGMTRVKHAWAELRYHWYVKITFLCNSCLLDRLRILLYYPRLRRTASASATAEASVFLLRSCSNIIHIHTELSHMGKLDPSWPQLKRIITCGQVLIICCARGEIHALESAGIFSRLFDLLEGHIALWPSASESLGAYKRAAKVLGKSYFKMYLGLAKTGYRGLHSRWGPPVNIFNPP